MTLCASITERSVAAALAAAERVHAAGALAEIRIDAFDEPSRMRLEHFEPFRALRARDRLLWTFRRPSDGGREVVDDRRRLSLLGELVERIGGMYDVEWECAPMAFEIGLDPGSMVLSHHDFASTPSDLVAVFERMTSTPAAIYKLATFATRSVDQFRHFDVLDRARALGKRAVAIAMGEKGIATRVLGPSRGAAFTFCAADHGRVAAPGQLELAAMSGLFRVDALSTATIVTGLVAGSVGYSRSPAIHNGAAGELGVDLVYVPFAVDDLAVFLREARSRLNLKGLSVTNPYKTEILPMLDRVDPLAQRVGAVNTVVVEGDELVGHNTDVAGAMHPLEAMVGDLSGTSVGVIGAGGAARAVLCGLQERGATTYVFGRSRDRVVELAESFDARPASLAEIGRYEMDILVNATPVGTLGVTEGESPVPAAALRGVRLVYDLVYNPEETRLLTDAGAAGCARLGGLPMLATQAALQFELWTGRVLSNERALALARP